MKQKISVQIQTDWSEMDMFGHVNNVSIFKYFQTSRVKFWEQIGIGIAPDGNGFGANLHSVQAKFILPIFYPETISVLAEVLEIRNRSFVLKHTIHRSDKTILAEGRDVVVLYNYNTGEKVEIPEDLRRKLEQFIG